jgi:glycosyltransferase 2 family protein
LLLRSRLWLYIDDDQRCVAAADEPIMRTSVKWVLKLILTVVILFGIAWKLDVRSVVAILPSLSPYAVVAAIALIAIQILFSAGRLSLIVGLFDRQLKVRDSFRVTLESLFFAQTFVSFLGSDALRIWRIRGCGAPLSQAAAAVALDRLLGIIVNHLFLLAALPWLLSVITDGPVRTGLLILGAAGIGGITVVLLLGFMRGRTGFTNKVPVRLQSSRIMALILEVSTVGHHFLVPRWDLFKAAGLSLLIANMNSLIFLTLLLGWQVNFTTAIGCAFLIPGILEIAMLPISIAGWGVREGVAIVAFGKLGVTAAVSFGTSVIFALILLLFGLVGGLLWLFDHRKFYDLAVHEVQSNEAAASLNSSVDSR